MPEPIVHEYVPGAVNRGARVVCYVSFNNPTTKAAFEKMFGLNPNAGVTIDAIEVTTDGITATFGRKLP